MIKKASGLASKTSIISKIKGNKKHSIFALCFLLPFLFIFNSCSNSNFVYNNLDVEASIGYDGNISLYKGNPLNIKITNTGADFNGEIRIKIPLNAKEEHNIVFPIEIASGSIKTIKKYIDIDAVVRELNYDITRDSRLIKNGKIQFTRFLKPEFSKIALFSDNPDNYKFLSTIDLSKNTDIEKYGDMEKSRTEDNSNSQKNNFILPMQDFESFDNRDALDFFDYIFIADISNLNLSDTGVDNILDWVSDGGILILESGENFEKMNRVIPQKLKQVDFEKVEEIEFTNSPVFKGVKKIASGKILRKDTEKVFLYDNLIAYKEEANNGYILTINTVLGNSKNLEAVSNGLYLEDILSNLSLEIDNNLHYLSVDRIPFDLKIPYELISFILVAYIIFVGPVLYLILKKLDKQNFIWIIAPSLSILLVLVISQLGSSFWNNKPIVNEKSIIEYKQGTDKLEVKSRLGFFNNQKNKIKINWEDNHNINIPISQFNKYYDYDDANKNLKKRVVSERIIGSDNTFYSYGTALWSTIFAEGTKSIDIKDNNSYISLSNIDDKQIIKLKNGIGIDFDTALLYWQNSYYDLGKVESDKDYEFDLSKLTEYKNIRAYIDIEDYDKQKRIFRYFDRNFEQNEQLIEIDKAYIIGYNKKELGYNVKINDSEAKHFAENLAIMNMNMEIPNLSKLKLDTEKIKCNVYSIKEDNEDLSLENQRTVYFDYDIENGLDTEFLGQVYDDYTFVSVFKIPTKININSIKIDFNNYCEQSFNYSSMPMPDESLLIDKYFIYNYVENKYDEVNFDATNSYLDPKWLKIDTAKYLSKMNEIKIKIIKDKKIFGKQDYIIKPNDIELEGVYND